MSTWSRRQVYHLASIARGGGKIAKQFCNLDLQQVNKSASKWGKGEGSKIASNLAIFATKR